MVYASDVDASSKVEVLATVPSEAHEPIVYPVAVVKGCLTDKVSQTMIYLQSATAAQVFERCGFSLVKKAAPPEEKKSP